MSSTFEHFEIVEIVELCVYVPMYVSMSDLFKLTTNRQTDIHTDRQPCDSDLIFRDPHGSNRSKYMSSWFMSQRIVKLRNIQILRK